MNSPSVRTAALAFALSSWVEGLSQLRTVLILPALPVSARERLLVGEDAVIEQIPLSPNATWRDRLVDWFKRSGRREVEMDDTERASLGTLEIMKAFLILQLLQQPLLPFLFSPFMTSLPIPRSTAGFLPTRWRKLFVSTVILAFIHEIERVSVFVAVDMAKKHREARNKALLGDVYIRGDELRPREISEDEEDEEDECMICAGAGADTSLSQSISSLASGAPQDLLGPLEAFCTTAPQKHIAHRSCFLSWYTACRQRRAQLPLDFVELHHPSLSESTRQRAQSIMGAAGFGHLSQYIRFPHELPYQGPLSSTSDLRSQSLTRPILTLTENRGGSFSSRCISLATLQTSTAPCPGCRSSVLLHFFTRPVNRSRVSRSQHTRQEAIKAFARVWIQNWGKLVTGRTLLYRLASQWSFVMALLSVIRVSESSRRWTIA